MEMSQDEAERMLAEAREKALRDREAELDYAMNKGLETGRAEGIAEGEAKGKAEGYLEVARSMKAKGMDLALISELTGLAEADILAL
jgi:predicted transposase/invertase (TIGR01784 family)